MAALGEVLLLVAQSLWLFLPAYLANMAPVFVGGGKPIDGGKSWKDGRRILGDGKTWRGILLGPVVSTALVATVLLFARTLPPFRDWGVSEWGGLPWVLLFAYALGLGALTGDAVESFFKRRIGKDRGEAWVGFDQLDFVVGALTFAFLAALVADVSGYPGNWFLSEFTWPRLLVLVVLTPGLHFVVNVIGYAIGKKDVPW